MWGWALLRLIAAASALVIMMQKLHRARFQSVQYFENERLEANERVNKALMTASVNRRLPSPSLT
jgi:hypothetical protein